jgi:membrane-associated phospholipid phosphatase
MYIFYPTRRCLLGYVFVSLMAFIAMPAIGQVEKPEPGGEQPVFYAKDSALPLPPPEGVKAHLYRMNYWVSGGFSALATGANIYAIPNLVYNKDTLTNAEIAGLNPDALNGFERWALKQDPSQAGNFDKTSDYILQGTVLLPALLGFEKSIRKDALRLLVMYYETHAVTFTLYNFSFFGPTFQNKYRPSTYYPEVPMEDRKSGNSKNSQYSGHTASAAAATFFLAKVYNDYHPEFSSGKKYMIYGLAAIPPLVQGYMRMKALKHFPSDILIGYIIGATCGIAVPEMHRFKSQAIKYSVIGTPVGPGLAVTWTPPGKNHTAVNTLGL